MYHCRPNHGRIWFTQLNSHVKLKIRDYKSLMSKRLVVAAVNIEPDKKIEFEAVLETCRLTVGQRIIHSLSQIVSKRAKQAFYQVVNQTPFHFTIHQHHDATVKRIQTASPFETRTLTTESGIGKHDGINVNLDTEFDK